MGRRKPTPLIDEYPLLVLPSLATAIGLNEAIALQQLHYWLENPNAGIEKEGHKWIYNTYEEWKEKNFPFWSDRTIQRVFLSLEKMGLVIAKQFDAGKYDRTKYYRVDYDKLEELNATEWQPQEGQDGSLDDDNLAPSTYTETTTETTTNGRNVKLTEQELAEANGLVDAMIAAAKKVTYENRDKIPPQYLDLSDTYVELTGQKPTKRVLMDWIATFADWTGEGLLPQDIRAAYKHATRDDGGFLVARPGSLTNTAVALKSRPQREVPAHEKAHAL